MEDGRSNIVLGVRKSVSGFLWSNRFSDARASIAFSQATELPEIVARVLVARGVKSDDAESFLNPTVRELMPDPSQFQDIDNSVERLIHAIERGEIIAVFGDYDVDGATSGGILIRYLKEVGAKTLSYVPDRTKEGYGPNINAFNYLQSVGVGLVVTVDCGITAFESLDHAYKINLDVIVVDHHVAEPKLPRAFGIINPNRLDESGMYGELAAVGVTFLLVVALNRSLRMKNWFTQNKTPEPDLLCFLDLVALGTICDVVPLTGLNRAFVKQGLKVMGKRGNIGIAALSDIIGLESAPGTYEVGFLIGPRVNAGGRVGEPSLGTRLLTTEDKNEAEAIATELQVFNEERKIIEADILDAATIQVLERESDGLITPIILVAGEGWHPGVTGIVASRLKDKFGRPSVVVAFKDGLGKASCRSIYGVDIGSAITAARQMGLLLNGGGHKMAAGFTVKFSNFEKLGNFLNERLASSVESALGNRELGLDGVLTIEGANLELLDKLQKVGPYGAGNSEPRFALSNVRITRADIVGKGHVRCSLKGESGKNLKAIAFRCADDALGSFLLSSSDARINLAGFLRNVRWRDRNGVQFVIIDAAPETLSN